MSSPETIDAVIQQVQRYAPGADVGLILDAYQYAALVHRGQVRKSGEDYLVHPLAVARILADLEMDVETIAVGLLHDTIEDTFATHAEIAGRYGVSVADMVDGVTKLSKLQYRGKLEEQAENFRKFVLAFGKDIRVMIVKIADRLHNMRTLEHHKPEKRRSVAQETIDIYAPLVHRLGLDRIKSEMEDLCLGALWPDAKKRLEEELAEGAEERERFVAETVALIQERLHDRGLDVEVSGRAKHLYSIFRKMEKQEKNLSEIRDLLAFRVLVPDRDQCYVTLGFVHAEFLPVAGRLKDYIAAPKPNGYQSLHTTVMVPSGREVELQIRTHAMHRIAETGIAAHWRYKSGRLAVSNAELEELARIRGFIQMAQDIEDPADFMEAARGDLAATIHVFTPRKDVVLISEASSALDFAYHVHTEVGNHAQGAKVNGRLVPLRTRLRSGDTVEIVTHADARPNRQWLEWAFTHRAMEKIRKRLRDQLQDQGIGLGREMLESALRKANMSLKRVMADPKLNEHLDSAGYKDLDQLALALVAGKVSPGEVGRLLVPDPEPFPAAPNTLVSWWQKVRKAESTAIVVSGQSDILVDYARCCRPMKGEPIVGYITRGRGLSVHRDDCAMVKGLDVDRIVAVTWDGAAQTLQQSLLRVVADDRPGLLADITALCAGMKINLWRANVRAEDQQAICELGVAVSDINQMSNLVRKLKGIKGVISVRREGGGD